MRPNGFLATIEGHDGAEFDVVAPAMHFDETPTAPAGPAPELGQDTELILADTLDYGWDQIAEFKEQGVIP